ncbi:MAG: hypothetical protein JSU96_09910 [Acidobacteriota bacterium]|nr:MAG: hypothetical protein JSU96_09910 [Acidobacteriota bacterium]
MKKLWIVLLVCLLNSLTAFSAQDPAAAPEQEGTPAEPQIDPAAVPVQPVELPRIPGEARGQEEWIAWQQVEMASTPAQAATAAQQFLENYPDSGLTAHAYYRIAQNDYALGAVESFILNAEKALTELPNLVDLHSQLAFFYAERGESAIAIDHATRALAIVDQATVPTGVSAGQWVSQVFQLRAESNYALGRAYLNQIAQDKAVDGTPNLDKAITYLGTALRFEPQHDFASFRLGFAERNAGNVEGTLMAYGRSVAIGKVAAQPAQAAVEEVLGILKRAMPDSPWAEKTVGEIVEQATQQMQDDIARIQAEQSRMIQELELELETQPAAAPAAETPLQPESPTQD